MQIALSRDDYEKPITPVLRDFAGARAPRVQAVPVRIDICRFLVATLGLALYVGIPALAIGYLGSQLFG